MGAFERRDWYDEPRYYDLLLEEDSAADADFLEALLERHAAPAAVKRGGVLEPACGSGRLVHEFARRGHRVLGMDLSRPMLDYAAERLARDGLEAELRCVPMQAFRTRRRFALAHCLVGSFRYLLTEQEARRHLALVAEALRPGGLYVIGLHLTEYEWQHRQRERWVAERNGTRVVCNLQSWPPDRRERTEHLRSRLTATENGRVDRLETHWDWRTYDARQLRRTLAGVPRLEHLATYDFAYDLASEGALDGEQLDRVLVLRRRTHKPQR